MLWLDEFRQHQIAADKEPMLRDSYPASAGTPADTGGMAYGWFIYSISINRNQYPVKTRQAPKAVGAGDLNTWWAGDDTGASGVGAGGAGTGPNGGTIIDTSEISVDYRLHSQWRVCVVWQFPDGADLPGAVARVHQRRAGLSGQRTAGHTGRGDYGRQFRRHRDGDVPMGAAFITDTINILNLIN